MKKKLGFMMLAIVFVLLAACGKGTDSNEKEEMPAILEVKLEVPEHVQVDENVDLKAVVTQGDEDVADADEVEFEVWEEGKKDDSVMIAAKNNQDGTYEAETTFDHDGAFTVQVHVTARGMHNMPKQAVTVGEGAAEENHDHGEHEHGDHAEGFSMHFMIPENVNKGEETDLVVHIQDNQEPMKEANVRYEIWKEGNESHQWLDAKEESAGEYSSRFTFEETGSYHIKIHVENNEGLHEHEEHPLEVKE
ncbi:FixH family protein [Lederbergia sp. NSJ-179]|uniref:FixH family protein n=1 Tax=Lederbergia sp. NSJ-179 TaxID=2931402 RepID=UPI001FD10F18|nr:FixH family protein [Lederbergia sp. NSJ-179]MCJ7842986.1 FixH family protein [Lederbergia sp. NSJ-179]